MRTMRTLMWLTAGAVLAATPAHANAISDQGFVRVTAVKAVCRDKQECKDLESVPAMLEALTIEKLFESGAPRGGDKAPPVMLILVPRPSPEDVKKDDGPVVW